MYNAVSILGAEISQVEPADHLPTLSVHMFTGVACFNFKYSNVSYYFL